MDDGFLMEVCVDSVESAVNAERGGLLQVVKQCVRVPVFVMIRPRGGDFLYSDREVEVMKADIRLAKLHGADGLVFGALTEDGRIDTELCTALLAVCRPLPVTFHRGKGQNCGGARRWHHGAQPAEDSGRLHCFRVSLLCSLSSGLRDEVQKSERCHGSVLLCARVLHKGGRCGKSEDPERDCQEHSVVAGTVWDKSTETAGSALAHGQMGTAAVLGLQRTCTRMIPTLLVRMPTCLCASSRLCWSGSPLASSGFWPHGSSCPCANPEPRNPL
uniref:Copper homeostasis protein cutC homolog n=1 Tax=Taeniopygia guttata TaxID=59729 RepID=H0ZGD8_TAEGU